MKTERVFLIALAAAALGTTAQAQTEPGKSSEQVRAETLAAVRNGDIMEPSGSTWRQLYPGMYPKAALSAGLSREQVVADTRAAIRSGELVDVAGESPRVVLPDAYPAAPVVAGKTRDEVRQELAVAQHDGSLLAPGRADLTRREESPQWYPHQ